MHSALINSDYYINWSSNYSKNDTYNSIENNFNTKVLNLGSVYLNELEKLKRVNNNKNFLILYLGSPFRKYRITEFEDTFENLFNKRSLISSLLYDLIKFNKSVKIIYKPFPYTYKNDPVTSLNKRFNDKNIFEISNLESTNLRSYLSSASCLLSSLYFLSSSSIFLFKFSR